MLEAVRPSTTGGSSAVPGGGLSVMFDVGHPAHVHLFKHAIRELQSRGHDTLVTSRHKDLTTQLLDAYDIAHVPISAKGESKLSLASEWVTREVRTVLAAASFDPDVTVSVLSPPSVHAARLTGATGIVFNDSEPSHLAGAITHPFADLVVTPSSFDRDLGTNQLRYDGFHELAYLHPDRFEPDRQRLESRGVDPDERYFVVRFVAWGAHHDVGQRGLSPAAKREMLDYLSERGEVYVTSETPLPGEFEEYRLPVPPAAVHDLLYYADLYVGDSQTMATEAGVLGTPAVRSNSFAGRGDMGNFVELESEYGLVHSTDDEDTAIETVERLVDDAAAAEEWQRRREALLADKVDVTALMVDLIAGEEP